MAINAREEFAGEELEILARLGIPNADTSRHRTCPFLDHEDKRPSWRWDSGKSRWFCTCGHGDVLDAIARKLGCNFNEARGFARGGRARLSERDPGKRLLEAWKRRAGGQFEETWNQSRAPKYAQADWQDANPAPADPPHSLAKGTQAVR